MRPGDLFLWDARYCPQPPHNIAWLELMQRSDFEEIWHGGEHSRDGVYCHIFIRRQPDTIEDWGEPLPDDP
jgi:hypothetical protein